MYKPSPTILFLASLAILLLLLRACLPASWLSTSATGRQPKPYPPMDSTEHIRYITRPGDTTITRITLPGKAPQGTLFLVRYLPAHIDTPAILQGFYTRFFYRDTLKNDTSALVVVADTVTQNRIMARCLYFQNRRPQQLTFIERTLSPAPPDQARLWAGPLLGGSPAHSTYQAGATLLYQSPNGTAYSYAYDAIGKGHTLALYFPIKLPFTHK